MPINCHEPLNFWDVPEKDKWNEECMVQGRVLPIS